MIAKCHECGHSVELGATEVKVLQENQQARPWCSGCRFRYLFETPEEFILILLEPPRED